MLASAAPAAQTPEPLATVTSPADAGVEPVSDDSSLAWMDQLRVIIDMLCRMIGCPQSQSQEMVSGNSLSQPIARLSATVSLGVPLLSQAEAQAALDAAIDGSVIADEHAPALGADYGVLRDALDALIAAYASGHPR